MLLMKIAQAPVILMMMPVKVRVRMTAISRANLPVEAGRGVFHNHSAQMQNRKKSPAEVHHNNGKVTAHAGLWSGVEVC